MSSLGDSETQTTSYKLNLVSLIFVKVEHTREHSSETRPRLIMLA